MAKINFNKLITNITGLTDNLILFGTGAYIYIFHLLDNKKFIFTNMIIISFVLALYDNYLKKLILFNIDNDYYKFIANNIITIVVIDFLIFFIKQEYTEINYMHFFNLAISCLFFETIVFKLYNFNKICNNKLRSSTKIIFRLATIHILSNFLNNKEYDKTWLDFSLSQLFNFVLFDGIFNENFFEDN
jgi:hypothetical protein